MPEEIDIQIEERSRGQWFLRDLREELELSQAPIAKAIQLPQGRLSAFERGTDIPTPEERRLLLDFMLKRAVVRGLEILILNKK